jgi:hypothetical protein
MQSAPDAALSTDAATLLAEYFHYADLAEHLRSLPEMARTLGARTGREGDIVVALEAETLKRLERLDALGLYPTTTTTFDVTVDGVPITLPTLCRESTINALPDAGSPTTMEDCMDTTIEHHDERGEHNGLDQSEEMQRGGPGFFRTYVRPYLGYAGTFVVGAVCGVIGARYFSTPSEATEPTA